MVTVREKLEQVYQRLFSRYGQQYWWPAEEPFEVIVGAILTQSTSWKNVEKAIIRLKNAGVLNPIALDEIPPDELAGLIYSSGYYNAKAGKLKAFARNLCQKYQFSLQKLFAQDMLQLRSELLSIYGIGQETADSIILYAARKPIFVIDAYTHRIMDRLESNHGKGNYTQLQNLFMDNLAPDERMYNEYHALLVRHGKNVCRKTPLCSVCCLAGECKSHE
jgi:endonuclease-3 related protein